MLATTHIPGRTGTASDRASPVVRAGRKAGPGYGRSVKVAEDEAGTGPEPDPGHRRPQCRSCESTSWKDGRRR